MAATREMYKILEEMLRNMECNKKIRVLELNKLFRKSIPEDYPYPSSKLDFLYENCRQSCVMAETMPAARKYFLKDAIKRFSKIPEPE